MTLSGAEDAKDPFVAAVVHDLRTPLSAIIGLAATLDVGSLVERVVNDSELRSEREIIVDADDVVAEIDESKVERIVQNLLTNDVRHTPDGARVCVSARADGDGVVILVDDEGPGVPAERREAIFDPFNKRSDDGPGVGIGLSLVRRFAELHGGRAWVESGEAGGASLRVWIPPRGPAP